MSGEARVFGLTQVYDSAQVVSAIPLLTTYDPSGASEGTLDALGVYQIAGQLATRLVPAVRERMQRVRFLTVMAIADET